MMQNLLEKILVEDKKSFDYSSVIEDFWHDLITKEKDFKNISFDLENDESKGDSKEITLDLKYDSGENLKVMAQLFSAGGDWQNSVGYFRCQLVGTKGKFIVIPDPEVNKNLVKVDKGYAPSDNSEVDGVGVGEIEKDLWKALKEELNTRLKPEVEEYDADYNSMRVSY